MLVPTLMNKAPGGAVFLNIFPLGRQQYMIFNFQTAQP
jgi:hypothetical protein